MRWWVGKVATGREKWARGEKQGVDGLVVDAARAGGDNNEGYKGVGLWMLGDDWSFWMGLAIGA